MNLNLLLCTTCLLLAATPSQADWKAATPDVEAAAKDARIAGALSAVNAIDQAAVSGDTAAFAALLAGDLAVNNPQNGVSVRGATAQRSAAGKIRYSRYDRVIEYAGLRGDLVLLMGEETVVPEEAAGVSPTEQHRRFTDLWQRAGSGWQLTARQATLVKRP